MAVEEGIQERGGGEARHEIRMSRPRHHDLERGQQLDRAEQSHLDDDRQREADMPSPVVAPEAELEAGVCRQQGRKHHELVRRTREEREHERETQGDRPPQLIEGVPVEEKNPREIGVRVRLHVPDRDMERVPAVEHVEHSGGGRGDPRGAETAEQEVSAEHPEREVKRNFELERDDLAEEECQQEGGRQHSGQRVTQERGPRPVVGVPQRELAVLQDRDPRDGVVVELEVPVLNSPVVEIAEHGRREAEREHAEQQRRRRLAP